MKTFPALLMAAAISIHSSLANDFQVGITVVSSEPGTTTSLKKNNRDDIGRAAQNGVNNGLEQDGLEPVSFDAAVRNLRTSRELQCNMMACNHYDCQTFRHDHAICIWFCSSCSWYRRLALASGTTAGTTVDYQQEAVTLAQDCARRISRHMKNSGKYNDKQKREVRGLICSVEVITKPNANGVSEKYISEVTVGAKDQVVTSEQLVMDYKTLEVLPATTLTKTSTTSLTTLDGPNV